MASNAAETFSTQMQKDGESPISSGDETHSIGPDVIKEDLRQPPPPPQQSSRCPVLPKASDGGTVNVSAAAAAVRTFQPGYEEGNIGGAGSAEEGPQISLYYEQKLGGVASSHYSGNGGGRFHGSRSEGNTGGKSLSQWFNYDFDESSFKAYIESQLAQRATQSMNIRKIEVDED